MTRSTYVVFKFYVPEYDLQSYPIPLKASYINKHGWRRSLLRARDIFLAYGLRPLGEIHQNHEGMWNNGMMTYEPKIRELTPNQLARMRGKPLPKKIPKKRFSKNVGWKRRYKRRN